jgi:hypothetical protein
MTIAYLAKIFAWACLWRHMHIHINPRWRIAHWFMMIVVVKIFRELNNIWISCKSSFKSQLIECVQMKQTFYYHIACKARFINLLYMRRQMYFYYLDKLRRYFGWFISLYRITKISALVIWNNHILVCRMNSIISNNQFAFCADIK